MRKDIVLLATAMVVWTTTVAQTPSRQYLPADQGSYPDRQYLPASTGQPSAPSNQLDDSRFDDEDSVSVTSAAFGGTPTALSRFGSGNTNQFGVSGGSTRFGRKPSNQYGVPSASNRLGNGQHNSASSASSRIVSGPSNQYGTPDASSRFGRPTPSNQYGAPDASSRFGGAPSNQYGAPDASSRFGGPATSNQYGAPSSSRFGSATPSSQYRVPGSNFGGVNGDEDSLTEPANYEFSYEVEAREYGTVFGHAENRQDENARGSYHVLLPDGRTQIVEYEADQDGYKPQIRYEDTAEPHGSGPY
ncbi:pro-resilin-like [Zootermopsis nevadensis]|uniref:Pro-resilin n=1 Tax=Zootermopsis nevadensis TaxID=136037 RepID=A0A067QS59_ZOONE|nr:pro-resilin-like [Zootermopsis nevadensis]KDR08115.1 Pro-resilin [Zootermopsis nevadensis]